MTKIIKIDSQNPDDRLLSPAVDAIIAGGICAFPTETVYGLGANAFDPVAVSKIFKAKGRPGDNPLIVHIAKTEDIYPLVRNVTETALKLAEEFWGGPLTIILDKSSAIPTQVSAGLDTVAIRLPSHPVANRLIALSGKPIAAPSANISGRPSPTAAKHVIEDMRGKADVIIDGGNCFFGVESTVLDLTVSPPAVLRPGAVTAELLSEFLGVEVGRQSQSNVPKSPGMKYKHYAPLAPLYIADSPEQINRVADKQSGVLCFGCDKSCINAGVVISMGNTASEYAARLFYALREMDEAGVKVIYAIPPLEGGMGDAVRNRVFKAAGGKKLTV